MASVISQHRFDPASRVVDRAVRRTGRFGTLTSAIASVAWWRGQGYYDSGALARHLGAGRRRRRHEPGRPHRRPAAVVPWAVRWRSTPQTALLAHERIEVEDTAVATVTFESGALAVLHATTAAYPGLDRPAAADGQRKARRSSTATSSSTSTPQTPRGEGSRHGPPRRRQPGGRGTRPSSRMRLCRRWIPRCTRQATSASTGTSSMPSAPAARAGVTVRDAVIALATVRAVYVSATLRPAGPHR